jgi:hypothetical protein
VPGVVQLAWAIAYGAEYLGTGREVRRIAGLKFQRPLLPRSRVRLTLARAADGELTTTRSASGKWSGVSSTVR